MSRRSTFATAERLITTGYASNLLHMRVIMRLDDDLFAELRRIAAESGRTLTAVLRLSFPCFMEPGSGRALI